MPDISACLNEVLLRLSWIFFHEFNSVGHSILGISTLLELRALSRFCSHGQWVIVAWVVCGNNNLSGMQESSEHPEARKLHAYCRCTQQLPNPPSSLCMEGCHWKLPISHCSTEKRCHAEQMIGFVIH